MPLAIRTIKVSDFPIGCVVIPADDGQAAVMKVPSNIKGIVAEHSIGDLFLVVWWEGKHRPGSWDQWVPSRFVKVADAPPAGATETSDGRLVLNGMVATTQLAPQIMDLKSLNTDGRTSCAACGHRLNDPGMGPAYRHCPICEP